jgi:hypothetical protein
MLCFPPGTLYIAPKPDQLESGLGLPLVPREADMGAGARGIEINETADQLAKLGAKYPLVGPKPACGISAAIAMEAKILGVLKQDSNRQRDS